MRVTLQRGAVTSSLKFHGWGQNLAGKELAERTFSPPRSLMAKCERGGSRVRRAEDFFDLQIHYAPMREMFGTVCEKNLRLANRF
jgi:hypothetical protein